MKKLISLFLTVFTLSVMAATDPKVVHALARADKAVIIDVREEDEIKLGMIDKAIWFPLSKFEKDKNWKQKFEKMTNNKKIFLYCRSGNRSGKVLTLLKNKSIASENIGGYEDLKKVLPTQNPSAKK